MSNEPILIVMAAGIGSRFGGVKQLASFGSAGECIIDYSLFDAYRAGFRRVVFVVNDQIMNDFREKIGHHVEERMEVHYAIQRLTSLPEGYLLPEGRTKPWGTAHAIMCCQEFIDAPFAAINGDDFYGRDAFQKIYCFLSAPHGRGEYAMAGFELRNTLSENGFVSRGICTVDTDSHLKDVVEHTHIIFTCDGPLYTVDGATYYRLDGETPVSMNMWGFTAEFMDEIVSRFPRFLDNTALSNPLKGEYFLPFVVNETLREGLATVDVLRTDSKWYGMTYKEDLPAVRDAIAKLIASGEYPPVLWD